MSNELSEFIRERDEALIKLDMDYARKVFPGSDDHVTLIALHKVRYEVVTIDKFYREASRLWLEAHGYTRFHGDWPPKGELPE